MNAERVKLTFNESEQVTIDGNFVTYIPDGFKYARDGFGGNEHWFYIVPETCSLDLYHVEAKPLSFGIVNTPIDIYATVSKDQIEGCKNLLIQNNALDISVAIFDLIVSEHCFFIYQRWTDSNENMFNKVNGFVFARDKMYQFHAFMNHDKPVSDHPEVIREFEYISRLWMKHVLLLNDSAYKAKGDPDEVKATLDDLSRMFVMAKQKLLPTIPDDMGDDLRKTYAVISGMFYINNNMQITPSRAQSVGNMTGRINGQEVSKDYLIKLLDDTGAKRQSITDVIRGFAHNKALKTLVTMDKLSNAGFDGGLAIVHFEGVQILLKTLCADNNIDYDLNRFCMECVEDLRDLFDEKWESIDAYLLNGSTPVIHEKDVPQYSPSSYDSKSSVLTDEQQRQKEELDRQIEDLKSQAAYYSSQNLSAEDRVALAEAKEAIDNLSKQMSEMSSDQAKYAEHLRQKEEEKKKEEEEKKRKKAELLAKGNTDDVAIDMFVILSNEKGLGKLKRSQDEFCRIYDDDFPTLNKKQMISMRKDIREKMKDPDFCEACIDKFKERSVKERFDVSTCNYYNVETGDFGKKVESAIDNTAMLYSREEFGEVRRLMKDHEAQSRKKLDDQLAPIESGWTKFVTAKKDLAIVIKDDADISENNEFFQVRTGGALVEVNLRTGGMLTLSTTLMNVFPWYWGKEIVEIWEAALKNEVMDKSTGWFDNDSLARQAVREIKKKYPSDKDYYRNKGTRFVQEIVKLYGQAEPLSNPVKAVKDLIKDFFPNEKEFAASRNSIADSNSLGKATALKELMDSGIPSLMAYKEIPEAVGAEIAEENKRKIEAKKNRAIQDAKDSLSDETLSGLTKSIELLKSLKEYDDFKEFQIEGKGVTELIKKRSEKINSVKEGQYKEALKLIESGTEESLTRAEKMLGELSSYKDSGDKAKEAKNLREMLRRYVVAQSMMANADISIVKKAEDSFRELGDYKDSAEKAKACAERIISIKSDKFAKAITLAEEGNEASISTALSMLKDISPFEDSENRITMYQKRLEDEKVYNRAVSMMSGTVIANIATVKEAFEGLGDYKDSAIKAAACKKYLDDLCEKKYQEAKDTQAVYTVDSQTLAMAAYSELGDYKDALERIAICTSNITVIQEIIELEEQLEGHKEELKMLTGFFKRRQRQEKEELINKVEQQIAELKEQLE